MTNKYYTPELSEFHHGFEYEVKEMCSINKGPRQIQWNKQIVNGLGSTELHWRISSYPEEIRVKYLDKKDLEDCGFECYKDVVINSDGFVGGKFQNLTKHNLLWKIHLFGSFTQLKIECFQDTSLSLREKPMKEWDFTADMMVIIKNKSEFKKLLKQLGI